MQKLENRCELLLIQHQKWMTNVTRLIVAHGMGAPHLHGYHRLTLAHFFLPEKGTIISVAPQRDSIRSSTREHHRSFLPFRKG